MSHKIWGWDSLGDVSKWEEQRHTLEGVGQIGVTRIGASDISVVTGSNRYKCPQRLFHHLTGFHHSFFITESTLGGHLIEPVVMNRWECYDPEDEFESLMNTRRGVRLRSVKKAEFFLTNPKYPNLFASLDYIFDGPTYSPWTGELYHELTPNEIKNTGSHYYRLWPDGITQQYFEQLQVQMMMGGSEVAVFHVYLDGFKYVVREVERDEVQCEYIDHKSREFAEIVEAGKTCVKSMEQALEIGDQPLWEDFKAIYDDIAPEPVGMPKDGDKDGDNVSLAKELYPGVEDREDELKKMGDEVDEYNMRHYLKCNEVIKRVNIRKDELKAKLLISCGDFDGIEGESVTMLNRRAKGGKRAYFSIKNK